MNKGSIQTAVLIGAGNVATHLGLALVSKGIQVLQVYSLSGSTAKTLAKKLNAQAINNLAQVDSKADIIILAVKDDAVESTAKQLQAGNSLVVHTAGSISIDVLKSSSNYYGVFYPFQTFNKNIAVDFSTVPLCIEAGNTTAEKKLVQLAKLLTGNYYKLNGEQRQWLHIMGVFASNFSNLMYSITHNIAKEHAIPFNIVLPLVEQTAAKIKTNAPATVQTGPAVRGDKTVLNKHLKMLAGMPTEKKIYKLLSTEIEHINKTVAKPV